MACTQRLSWGIVAVAALDVPEQLDEARIILHLSYRT